MKKKTLIIIGVSVILLSGSVAAYYLTRSSAPATTPAPTTNPTPKIPGPTDEEKKETEAHKDELARQNQQGDTPTSGQKTVTPIITSAFQNGSEIRIAAFVTGIFENEGTCTFTFDKASKQFAKTTNASANASTTDCAPLLLNKSDFPESGSWNVKVNYGSSKSSGTSEPKSFVVQ